MNTREKLMHFDLDIINIFTFIIFLVYPLSLSLSTTIPFLRPIGASLYFLSIAVFVIKSLIHLRPIHDGNFKVLMIFCIFYTISLLIFITTSPSQTWIFKDLLYSIFPCIVYLLFRASGDKIDFKQIFQIIVICVIISDVISLIMYFNPEYTNYFFSDLKEVGYVAFKLSGPFGLIITGYSNIIALSLIVFGNVTNKKSLMIVLTIFFAACALLTTQRTPLSGLALVLCLFLLKKKIKSIIPIIVLVAITMFSFDYITQYLELDNIISTFNHKLLPENLLYSRETQQVIYNNNNFFFLLFGEGVGKYSPENPFAQVAMPDAMYFRIYNEMGIIGILLYLYFAFTIIHKAFKDNNYLVLSVALYSFFATGFNRVLFNCPFSIMSYIIMASLYMQKPIIVNTHKSN